LYKERMEKEYPLDACFEKAYYSHELRLRKPDVEIFKYVLTKNHLVAEETLFVDDTPANVDGAVQAGIHAILLPGETAVEDLFSEYQLKHHLTSSKSI
jgi:glucose-1-phosphatase